MSTDEPTRVMSVPKELWRIVDFIYKNGMTTKDVFFTSGDKQEVDEIVENLDENRDFRAFSVSISYCHHPPSPRLFVIINRLHLHHGIDRFIPCVMS